MDRSPYNEKEWVQQLMTGDAQAFRKIYEYYQGRIFLFALRLTKSRSKAEEIVQEVFIRLWEKHEQIKADKNFSAYIIQITKNLILDDLRKATLDRKLQEKIYKNMQVLKSPVIDKLLEKELARLHRQAIENLSPKKKVIYLLSREEELTYEQIAEKLNISKNTVRNQMAEALQSIREYLASHPDLICLLILALYKADGK